MKTGFVILNYHNHEATALLLQNLSEQLWYTQLAVYVVENGSDNDSLEQLRALNQSLDFTLIVSSENLGFARGNNLGISAARANGCNTVICCNSDIIINRQPEFLDRINALIAKQPDIFLIAPDIVNLDHVRQNPFRPTPYGFKEKLKAKLFFSTGLYLLYYVVRVYLLYPLITAISLKRKARNTAAVREAPLPESATIYAAHGCFCIFTPTFFRYFDGFDPSTFLYCEELILAEKIRRAEGKVWFDNTLQVIHQEEGSTNMVAKSYRSKVKFTLWHTLRSCRFFAKLLCLRS